MQAPMLVHSVGLRRERWVKVDLLRRSVLTGFYIVIPGETFERE